MGVFATGASRLHFSDGDTREKNADAGQHNVSLHPRHDLRSPAVRSISYLRSAICDLRTAIFAAAQAAASIVTGGAWAARRRGLFRPSPHELRAATRGCWLRSAATEVSSI